MLAVSNAVARSRILRRLGFTDLESDVYTALAGSAGLTPYAAARAVARPTANVYKAVDALVRKGAVLLEDGNKRLCRAVPPDLLLDRLHQTTHKDIEEARRLFAETPPLAADERVYRLETPEEVFLRAAEMLGRARQIAVVDAFPAALEQVRDAIAAAAARGVQVLVEAYAPCTIAGADTVIVENGTRTLESWRSEQLNVVVDGREHVAALLSADLSAVHQGIWSDSVYLSCLMHAGRLCEHTLIKLARLRTERGMPAAARRILEDHPFFATSRVPGQVEILERFAPKAVVPSLPPARRKRR